MDHDNIVRKTSKVHENKVNLCMDRDDEQEHFAGDFHETSQVIRKKS